MYSATGEYYEAYSRGMQLLQSYKSFRYTNTFIAQGVRNSEDLLYYYYYYYYYTYFTTINTIIKLFVWQ